MHKSLTFCLRTKKNIWIWWFVLLEVEKSRRNDFSNGKCDRIFRRFSVSASFFFNTHEINHRCRLLREKLFCGVFWVLLHMNIIARKLCFFLFFVFFSVCVGCSAKTIFIFFIFEFVKWPWKSTHRSLATAADNETETKKDMVCDHISRRSPFMHSISEVIEFE